jgi:hypothetical protein
VFCGAWLVASVVISAAMFASWARLRRFDRHTRQAMALTQHPSRPTGPEDEPRWKEWAASE